VQDERDLVRSAQQHDGEAFAQLYDKYFNKIYRYVAFKVGNKAEAEDMAQQVFVSALQNISSFKWRNIPFSAWLFRIAHNKVVDYLRKKSRQATVPLEGIQVVSASDPQRTAELRLDIEWLKAATGELTAAQREVITLRFAGDLPIAQVAQIMGKSQGAVKALQHSAIIALRKARLGGENGRP
jgi:RNA polymerase sigma-70 factor (ECF subfamily)